MRKRKRLSNGSLMIRMIDVVFILLFGFVAVSQISQAEEFKPPKSEEADESAPEGPEITIIGVHGNSTYTLEGGSITVRDMGALQRYLQQASVKARQNGADFKIRIRSNFDTPIDECLRVAKLCRDLGYAKGIDVVRSR